jgi:hypothetical protein
MVGFALLFPDYLKGKFDSSSTPASSACLSSSLKGVNAWEHLVE